MHFEIEITQRPQGLSIALPDDFANDEFDNAFGAFLGRASAQHSFLSPRGERPPRWERNRLANTTCSRVEIGQALSVVAPKPSRPIVTALALGPHVRSECGRVRSTLLFWQCSNELLPRWVCGRAPGLSAVVSPAYLLFQMAATYG